MKQYKEDLLPLLDKLPVPELAHTLSEVKKWAEPFLTASELAKFEQLIKRFETEDAKLLQERLKRHEQQTKGSWLAGFWQESYLSGRGCVQSETNFALTVRDELHEHLTSRAQKATQLIYQLTKIYLALTEGSYPLEYTKNQKNIDMSYYENLFGSCRIPDENIDLFYKSTIINRHIIVVNKGSYYQLDVIDSTGKQYPPEIILESIEHILSQVHVPKNGEENLAYMTGVKRKTSYAVYQQLKAEKLNSQNCDLIENALFVLSFTDSKDQSVEERIATVLLDGQDQIFSKTLQAIITSSGSIGFNVEHTPIDGVPTLNILAKVFDAIKDQMPIDKKEESAALAKSAAPENSPALANSSELENSPALTKRLSWQFTPELLVALEECRAMVEQEAQVYKIQYRLIESIGKNRIKELKVSPDAYFHMALAVAQMAVFGRLQSVYEPVAMRSFYEGRTECARSLSKEKKDFAEAYLNTEKLPERDVLKELFLRGASAHSERISMCQSGLGVERHLFGLQKMAGDDVDANYFFKSEPIKKLTYNFISTTSIPSYLLEAFSFCPVEEDGFGLYYEILEDQIVLTVSSKLELAKEGKQLLQKLEEYLLELEGLLVA
ncbi:MAG: choline/carnitine O-acyltransferase [Coriobacteriales bacterium]|jgi:carnitine O-acetyltransferase|nr:choline/carnitine O-acyltransferase [Coriobacteriales bacterium]